VLVVTHEKELVNRFEKRVVYIQDGELISDRQEGFYGYE
jgi:cell division transport system ATP-binding protein